MQNAIENDVGPRTSRNLAQLLISLVLVLGLLYIGRLFFITLISAVLLAFILEPAVNLFMRLRMPRGLASFLASSLMLAVVYLAGREQHYKDIVYEIIKPSLRLHWVF